MTFSLTNLAINNALLQNFICNPNRSLLSISNVTREQEQPCLTTLQKIASERKHETPILISLKNLNMEFLREILKTIEGKPNISELVFTDEGMAKDEAIVEISNALTQQHCSIEKLCFSLGKTKLNFLPLAQALQRNQTVLHLRLSSFRGPNPATFRDLECIFQALAGIENPASTQVNTSVQTLCLQGIHITSLDNGPALKSCNLMLKQNQSIIKFGYFGTDIAASISFSDFDKLKPGLISNRRLSELDLSGIKVSADELPKLVFYLPPHLEVLNLSHLNFPSYKGNLIEGLINLIKECKKEKLSLHIIFNGNKLEYALG
ncbi:hypothetical protein EAS68_12105 [Legionella jordanis]|nr:hypothetical protein [Legionella jordanis]RMX15509.1 hypothetical protein EAS68_12105 [Legionella jordanis]